MTAQGWMNILLLGLAIAVGSIAAAWLILSVLRSVTG